MLKSSTVFTGSVIWLMWLSLQDEYSQPYLKPPHLDQPISTLLLSESKMAFGHTLVNDNEGNYKGPLMLNLKEGYASLMYHMSRIITAIRLSIGG